MSGPDPQVLAQWEEAGRWFAKADEDIRGAALMLAADPPLIDPAAYHCQQAAEKIMKGLLVAVAIKVPRTHDLEILAGMVAPLFPALASRIDWFIPVTEWATVTRYPDFEGGLGAGVADITETLGNLRALRLAVAEAAPLSSP